MTARRTNPSKPHETLAKQLEYVGIQGFTREYRAIPGRRYRIDIAFPEQRIAVEVMGGVWVGGRHTRGAGYETDSEKICLLAGLGWTYLQVTPDQIRKGQALKWIENAIRARKAA